jgi:hypothetical protein
VNTIAATTNRIPRTALIALGALVVAFALLMIVRMGVLGGSESTTPPTLTPTKTATPSNVAPPKAPTKPAVVLLPNLPPQIAAKLRYSKVVVVSLYVGQAPADRLAVGQARTGARAAGAGFVAINVGADKNAGSVAPFVGPVTMPALLVVRRPGKIVTQIPGQVESAIVAQAARNAGARR